MHEEQLMFRALLWKEWRELWVLPVVAAPLAAFSFLVAQPERLALRPDMLTRALTSKSLLWPNVWMFAFSFWLVMAAAYIPSHLFSREKETGSYDFLSSRPLDRLRLWCFKLITGITILLSVGAVLYIVAAVLSLPHAKAAGYTVRQADIVFSSTSLACVVFSFSLLFSALLNRQILVVAGLLLFFLLALFGYSVDPARDFLDVLLFPSAEVAPFTRTLVLCPPVLLISLATFARKNVQRQTHRYVIGVYLLSAVAAAIPLVVGISQLPPKKAKTKSKTTHVSPMPMDSLWIRKVSADGTCVLLIVGTLRDMRQENLLVLADLSKQRVSEIDKGIIYVSDISINVAGRKLIYLREKETRVFSSGKDVIISDFEGVHRTDFPEKDPLLFSLHRWRLAQSGPWSLDGKYIGLGQGFPGENTDQAFVAIYDSDGDLVWKHEFAVLEDPSILPIGWDYESRFCFVKLADKRGLGPTYWRVWPDKLALEQFSAFSENGHSYVVTPSAVAMSPNGRWIISYERFPPKDRNNREIRLQNISNQTKRSLLAEPDSIHWSHDGKRLAFTEHISTQIIAGVEKNIRRKLIVYEPETDEKLSIPLDRTPGIGLHWSSAWSPSDDYVLLMNVERRSTVTNNLRSFESVENPWMLSPVNGQINPIAAPAGWGGLRLVAWISDDRLLWAVNNRLITTEADGSNPKEILRVEDGKIYINGVQAL